jgi:hypothetical protein
MVIKGVDCVKKIIFLCLVFTLYFCNFAFASPSVEEVNTLNDQFQTAKYKLESGINFTDFNRLTSDLYVATKKFTNKYPDEQISREFEKVISLYNVTKYFWNKSFSDNFIEEDDPYRVFLTNKFPEIAQICGVSERLWPTVPTYNLTFNEIHIYQEKLDKYIADNYPKKQGT